MESHRLYEDILAIVTGAILVSFGMMLYAKSLLLTGGTVGLGLLVQYVTRLDFSIVFVLINLPFFVLALWRMGWKFTLRTVLAVLLVSLFSRVAAANVDVAAVSPLYATVLGGLMTGIGLLILFRHRTGLGGTNILVLFLHEKLGWRTGYMQLAIDFAILFAAYFVLPPQNMLLSVLGAAIVNSVLAINHKPGRYLAVS